ncbi:MAG TPA: hypothetical protein VK817_22710 [Trebonia sp.]|jgi:hypothetical protein|nr:hypothetical protein [Trebonia sp.]
MTDLKNLLGRALDDAPGAARAGETPGACGVEDDLARGQRLLRKRNRNRMLGASAAVAAVAVAVIVPTVATGTSATHSPSASAGTRPGSAVVSHPAANDSAHSSAHSSTGSGTTSIKLVGYNGAQPPGYTVKVIPDHWVIQGSNPFALTIAPANASNKNPNVFIGKLVVMEEDFDASQPGGLKKVDVPGHTAYYGVSDNIASLIIEQTPSNWLDIQAPTSLGWTEQQEAQFGTGVTILPTAQQGKG